VSAGGIRAAHLQRALAARARRSGRPADDVVLFAQLLRACGAVVPGGAAARAVRALAHVRLDHGADVQDALRATLVVDRAGQRLLDLVFPAFWSTGAVDLAGTQPDPAEAGPGRAVPGGGASPVGDTPEGGRPGAERAPRPADDRERGDGDRVADLGGREIDALARRFHLALARLPGRRRRTAREGDALDLRSSMRHNLHSGVELVTLLRSRPRPRRVRLVVLCDVSASMAPVTALFLAFVHALARHASLAEVGLFNVDLTLVGDEFRRRTRRSALRWLRQQEHALAGGTRIGHCLQQFLDAAQARGLLSPDTVAIVLSDGWDTGDIALLGAQMRRLRGLAGRVLWCDPHAAATGFAPEVAGLRAALPHVDHHLDLSGVSALRALVAEVERTARTTPARRPAARQPAAQQAVDPTRRTVA
jgi:uncharacterized protein